jgi:hypothetical protein
MHHFGQGLVRTPGDFGLRGDPPTHPELLDWLAAEFVDPTAKPTRRGGWAFSPTPWSIKHLHQLILTSETYRQQSLDRTDGRAADPDNRLLWRANRRRLDFESLHDALLAVSGSLDPKAGGPPVKLLGANRRRAVYGYVDRLEFPSLLSTFDVPNPAASVPERSATTVAPQALYLMNGPFPRDSARRLASVTKTLPPVARVDGLFRAAFGRPPSAEEKGWAIGFVWQRPTADRWVDLAHGLLLTNEFTFID